MVGGGGQPRSMTCRLFETKACIAGSLFTTLTFPQLYQSFSRFLLSSSCLSTPRYQQLGIRAPPSCPARRGHLRLCVYRTVRVHLHRLPSHARSLHLSDSRRPPPPEVVFEWQFSLVLRLVHTHHVKTRSYDRPWSRHPLHQSRQQSLATSFASSDIPKPWFPLPDRITSPPSCSLPSSCPHRSTFECSPGQGPVWRPMEVQKRSVRFRVTVEDEERQQ